MIDNFDRLVERCTAKRRRLMIRRSLLIVSSILFIISIIAGYSTWSSSPVTPIIPQPAILSPVKLPVVTPQPTPTAETTDQQPIIAPQLIASKHNSDRINPSLSDTTSSKNTPLKTSAEPVSPLVPPKATIHNDGPSEPIFNVSTQPKTTSVDPLSAFDKNQKYETAVAVARDYYGKNNFVEAAVWAKKANQMNREQEEAWLLYAQAYWAQGRKKEAIGVLELYMNYKDSKAASELYRTWKLSSPN
ncbi:MAG: tetratricopeptide repeat protein [Sulfuricurvum sp.]|nr:tetratricopeptide repeat protein [Sulfuricurvum sp.]